MYPQSTISHSTKSTYLPLFEKPTATRIDTLALDESVHLLLRDLAYQSLLMGIVSLDGARRSQLERKGALEYVLSRYRYTMVDKFFIHAFSTTDFSSASGLYGTNYPDFWANLSQSLESHSQRFFDLDKDSPLYKDMEDILERMESNQLKLYTRAEVWNE